MSWSCGLLWEGETEYCQVTLISLFPTLVLMWFLNFPELMKEMIGWEEIWSKEIAFCLVLLCSDISVLCAWQIFKTNTFLNVFLGYIYTENIHRYSLLCRIYILSLNSFDLSYCSIVKWCSTICNPMDYKHTRLPFFVSWNLLKFMSIESVMLSNHLILCCPLLLPSVFPSIKVFFQWVSCLHQWPKCWSFNFSISLSNEYLGLISIRIDWFDILAVQRILKRFTITIWKHQFFSTQSSLWSSFHILTWLLEIS